MPGAVRQRCLHITLSEPRLWVPHLVVCLVGTRRIPRLSLVVFRAGTAKAVVLALAAEAGKGRPGVDVCSREREIMEFTPATMNKSLTFITEILPFIGPTMLILTPRTKSGAVVIERKGMHSPATTEIRKSF